MRRSTPCEDSPPQRPPAGSTSEGTGHDREQAAADVTVTELPLNNEGSGVNGNDKGRSHTVEAGRALFKAVKSDLTGFGRHLVMLLASALARPRRAAPADNSPRTEDARVAPQRGGAIVMFVTGAAVAMLLIAITITGGILWALHDVRVAVAPARLSLVLETADGCALGRSGGPLVSAARRSDVPTVLVNAVLSIEDRRFYQHIGIDPLGILRAARANYGAGEIVQGGSTITQQLVKLRLVGRERTLDRKLREAFAALWLDFRTDKDEILTDYLNHIYFGAGAYGVSAAAHVYFGKRLNELSVAEAAMLAGLIRSPSDYNPIRDPEKARRRAAEVLDAMIETGAIDAKTAAAAKAAPAEVKATARFSPAASWFADWITKHEFPKAIGADTTRSITVRTTLVPELQQAADRVVADALKAARRGGPSQAALVAMRPDGAVVAMVGGRDYDQSQFNRAADARRQPGSAFKLFVYLAALRSGYSPGDVIDASPIRIKRWEPENFGGRRYDKLTLQQAFAHSVNTAAVRLAIEVGLDKVIAAARDLGIDAPLASVPSLALGTSELTLVDLTGAFASVRAGRRVDPFGIMAFGAENQGLRTLSAPKGSALSHHQDMAALLRHVVTSGTGRGADTGGFVAGKTGTSQDHRDAWFVGFNERLVVGVWVGNDDNSPMRDMTGGSLPAQIWRRFSEASAVVGRAGPQVAADDQPTSSVAPRQTMATDGRGDSGDLLPFRAAGGGSECDVEACTRAYRSFRASDCTYQPYGSARRICTISPRTVRIPEGAMAQAESDIACNVEICSRRYRSLDPTDCSYQPYGGGPRRICNAGQ